MIFKEIIKRKIDAFMISHEDKLLFTSFQIMSSRFLNLF